MPNDEIFNLVALDITDGLGSMFSARDDQPVVSPSKFDDPRVIGDGAVAAVPWVYRCQHTGDFEGLLPTNRPIDIHGVTLVDNRDGATVCYRYVDWLGVVNQLGLEVSWRVPVNEEQYRNAVATLHLDQPEE